jgi:RNA polymerase sigma-70 factor, ECF subfamily
MDDQELIRKAQGGDATSFAELLDLYYDTIHRFAWKWCGHAANADDIAQLACLKLANSLAQYRFQAAFTSWLYRLVISCAQDWQRSQQRHEHGELPEDEPAEGEGSAEESIYLMQLLAQLEKLGEGMRETALLVHAEGLSHAEAGAILGVSESTISWRVHTIRKHLGRPEVRAGSGS